MKRAITIVAAAVAVVGISGLVISQPPPPRTHHITQKGTLTLVPSTEDPPARNKVSIEIVGDQRVIESNGIPNHKTGQFPNRGNPNRITQQSHSYRIPAKPEIADRITPMHGMFGVAINGVPFDPGAGEFWDGEPGWQYEPLSAAIDLGIDMSHAHVQPTGKYHYHGLPTGLIDSVAVEAGSHSPLIGWAADGFPMYAVYGYSDPADANSPIQKLTSSWQLKQGERPGGSAPDGTYDGTFVADYEYVAGSGDLDECNGRQTVTPEFPEGTYAYFMTEQWPVVPRSYRGTPSADFRHGPPGGSGGGRHGGGGDDRQGPPSRGGREQQARGPRGGGPPRPGEVLPDFVREQLKLTREQRQQLEELQQTVDAQLKEILTAQQQQQLEDPRSFGPPPRGPLHGGGPPQGGSGGPPQGGRGGPGGRPPRR